MSRKSISKQLEDIYVPCDGCTLCCRSDAVRIMRERGDRLADYVVESHSHLRGQFMLAHKQNGDCVYLNETGCTIHGKAPYQCRVMDCRSIASHLPKETADRLGIGAVWDKGNSVLTKRDEGQ